MENSITSKEKISYGLGGLGKNLAYGLVSSYTLYYYNTVLGVSAAFIGTILMIARIFDAFNDPFMGIVIEKTNSRFGKYKPWIISGAVLNAIVMYAMFSVPYSLTDGSLRAYLTVIYFLCGITYTLTDIPYWSIVPAVTVAGKERESLTVVARTFAGIGAAAPLIFTMAIIPRLGGGTDTAAYRVGFSRMVLIISIIYVVTTIITVINLPSKEVSSNETSRATVKEMLSALIKNEQAMGISGIIILFNGAIYLTSNLAVYMFRYIIENETQYTYFMVISGIAQFTAMVVLYPLLRKKFSNRKIFTMAICTALLGYLVLTVMIFVGEYSFLSLMLPGACISLANGTAYVQITVFVAGAVDYGERKTGKRENSIISSLQTLMGKVSSAVAVFVSGIGLEIAKLNEGIIAQTASTITGLKILFAIPPLVLMLGGGIIFFFQKEMGRD